MAIDDWPELELGEVLRDGIPPYPEADLPGFAEAFVAVWRDGDLGAALRLYWDPADEAMPMSHLIDVARYRDGQWEQCGGSGYAAVPGLLSWRPVAAVEWTATAQLLSGASTLWLAGGVLRDQSGRIHVTRDDVTVEVAPHPVSCCVLVGGVAPPQLTISDDDGRTRRLGHWPP